MKHILYKNNRKVNVIELNPRNPPQWIVIFEINSSSTPVGTELIDMPQYLKTHKNSIYSIKPIDDIEYNLMVMTK